MIAAHPVEPFLLDVGVILIVDEELAVCGLDRVSCTVLDRLLSQHFPSGFVLMRKLPGSAVRSGVVLDVFDVATALQHQGFQTLLTQFLGRPPAGNARTHDDGVEGVVSFALEIQVHGLQRIGFLTGF